MVRKILGFFYKETNNLNQAAFLLGLFAFLSQILAFLRDRLLAHIFGASETLDIYYAAFRIPDFIFVTVASVVSLSVLVPFIVEKESEGQESLKEFISNIFSFFSILILAVALLAFFFMPFLCSVLFKGFSPQAIAEVVFISRILLLSPIILGFSNLLGSLTQAFNRFTVYALAPILYNTGIIIGIIFLAGRLSILGVAIGVVLGASLHALVQIPSVVFMGLFPKISIKLNFRTIARIISISLPRTLTLSMTHISTIFLVSLASLMVAGSISVFSLAHNLQNMPLTLVGVSYSLAAFPTLSRRFRENNVDAFKTQIATTARFIIFWSLPLTALFIVLRAQIVRVVLGSGQFSWDDTRLTAAALALFIFSSLFQCLMLLFMRGFYSAGFTKKPLIINFFSSIVMVLCAWGLVKFFYVSEALQNFTGALLKVSDIPGTVILMLPLAYSIATIINGLILWFSFEREFRGFSNRVLRTFFESLSTSILVGASAYVGLGIFEPLFNTGTLLGIFLQGLTAGIFATLIGFLILKALKNKEISDIWDTFHRRFWKTKVISTDPEIV